ncbi:hypothetical protein [Diaphorobacter sp.]|uniref:hypothetical protein n=1 Tax=Diaphorobacter sp. TaxID=1934310 RepID=UPI002586BAD0|nr:hypothetical protein [Diaphorobacter sp.]
MNHSKIVIALITLIAFIVLLPLEATVRSSASTEIYRFYAGFVLSIISTTAFAVFVSLIKSFRRGTTLQDIDPDKWTRPFSIAAIAFLFFFGLLIWYVSWEGKGTGVWYGLGFFVGGLLTEFGIGHVIKSGR